MKRRVVVAAALLACASSAMAQDLMKVVKGDGIKWVENPVFKGVQMAVLVGDPKKADPLVYRLKFPLITKLDLTPTPRSKQSQF